METTSAVLYRISFCHFYNIRMNLKRRVGLSGAYLFMPHFVILMHVYFLWTKLEILRFECSAYSSCILFWHVANDLECRYKVSAKFMFSFSPENLIHILVSKDVFEISLLKILENRFPLLYSGRTWQFIYLFIYSLFNDAFSVSDYIASNERMLVNNELERMWKEADVV
jgi:hypothetical protein